MRRLQRFSQAAALAIFLGLLILASYPLPQGLPVDFFLRLDPLIGVGTMIAGREVSVYLLPSVVVILAALFLGRFFCGHICPMGTTLDMLQVPVVSKRRRSVQKNSYEATSSYRNWKYWILIGILAGCLAGVSLIFVASPLSLITRFYGLVIYPVLLLAGDSLLNLASPLAVTFPWLAYLQVPQKVFAANVFVFVMLVGIATLARIQPRFWCRNLCPAGALLAVCSRTPIVRRKVNDSCNSCGKCIRACPTGAIGENPGQTAHSECIVCLRCREICPQCAISFSASGKADSLFSSAYDPTRRGILWSFFSGLITAGLLKTSISQPRPLDKERAFTDGELIRPPGALPEPEFLTKCVRCGECMRACATNTLQPVWLKAGLEGLFTPVMVPRLAACAVDCNACGKVCPTGAIRDISLIEKNHAKVGTAWIARENCLVWEQDKKCLVCDEVCPYNAISFQSVAGRRNAAPFVIANRCTGCGWCESKCPVEGTSAIRINIIGQIRLTDGSYIEKADEFGFVFRSKDNSQDELAPETFDIPGLDSHSH
ncbi:MAG: 4Fe-4S binding protein [Deltaproteobacteria bacterium]|nr:4Fe-4S binding protein [Deltaproteobacteria bacterium]